jgi:hypothetical protein
MTEQKAGFAHGVYAGFCGFLVLLQIGLATQLGDLEAMYRDFGNVTLPFATRLTIHPAWIYGTPIAGITAVALLLVRRPRSWLPYIAVTVLLVAIVGMTFWYPRAPIYALAGNISAQ